MKKSIFTIAACLLLCQNLLPTLTFAQYTKLHDFEGTLHDGYTYGSLISDGTFLYGMTHYDGTYDLGTIFKIKPDGTGYTKILDFTGTANGSGPYGDLIYDGTFLYGMTSGGGTNNWGTIFKIKPDGTGYSKLLDFANDTIHGYGVSGSSLISDGTFLYGMTLRGGSNDMGTIFKIKLDGTGYSKLLDFVNDTIRGYNPHGSLISDGIFLYGMTAGGGTNDMGTIFKIKPDGTGYSKLMDFSGATNGRLPVGALISDGTFLYGMTMAGGTNNRGTIFKIKPDGTGYSKLLDFAGATNGSYPQRSLIYDGTFLYGMTEKGGTGSSCYPYGCGVIFKIKPDGTEYSKLLDFQGNLNGSVPRGSLISNGTFLFGMTFDGGSNDLGTIFKILPDGTGYTKLLDFTRSTDGSGPYHCSLISDGTFLYGMTEEGGTNFDGTIFKIKPDGTGYSKLFDFEYAVSGSRPVGALISVGTFLYGVTGGTIFKIKPDGTGFFQLFDFSNVSEYGPTGPLMSDGTFLYGMTMAGGINDMGTIFKIKPDGTGYSKLLDFTGANGSSPHGSLVSDGTFLYGTTSYGGTGSCTDGCGVIFKIKPDGTGYSKLLDFTGSANGSYPRGSLIFEGSFLYGTTESGGTNGNGTIFKIKPNGTGYSKLFDFAGANGGAPGDLISDGTFLYGMAMGGTKRVGIIFKYKLPCTNVTYSQSPTRCAGQSITIGTHTYTTSGNYTDVLTSYKNCDSTVTTHLTVLPPSTFSQTKTVCAGQSVTVGTHTYATSGNYTDVLISYQNCDSTVTTHLTVLPAITFSQTKTICAGQSITVGTHTYTTSGNYTDVLTSYQNCDSTVTTHLAVLPAITFSQTKTLCAGQSVTVGTHTYTTSGNYTDVLMSHQNCDSTVITNLTVLPAITYSQTHTLCAGQNIIVGSNTYTSSGNYTDVLISYQGCDSIVTTQLVVNSVDTAVTVSTVILTANASPATYQWINCNNGNTPIAGQTNQSFTASTNGNYAAVVTQNDCSDTSSCYTIFFTGIVENSISSFIKIYPNPFTFQTTITFSHEQKQTPMKIMDDLGKEIKNLNFTGSQLIIEKGDLPPGIYFLQVTTELGIVSKKMIISK